MASGKRPRRREFLLVVADYKRRQVRLVRVTDGRRGDRRKPDELFDAFIETGVASGCWRASGVCDCYPAKRYLLTAENHKPKAVSSREDASIEVSAQEISWWGKNMTETP
jgi:hypothetical protein